MPGRSKATAIPRRLKAIPTRWNGRRNPGSSSRARRWIARSFFAWPRRSRKSIRRRWRFWKSWSGSGALNSEATMHVVFLFLVLLIGGTFVFLAFRYAFGARKYSGRKKWFTVVGG